MGRPLLKGRVLEHPPELKQKHAPLRWGINKGYGKKWELQAQILPYVWNALARAENIKTPLGERLRQIRREIGDPTRANFAARLGVSEKTLGNYERGDSAPDANVVAKYCSEFGVNPSWLLGGHGEMFADPSKAPARLVDQNLMAKLARIIGKAHKELGIGDSSENIAGEAAGLYNDLCAMVQDIRDEEETEAALQYLAVSYKKKARARHPYGQTPGEKTAS